MDIDIYRSITNRRKFLAVPVGLSPAALALPDPDLANLASYKFHHRFDPHGVYQGANAADIAFQLKSNGFAVFQKHQAEH